MTQAGPDHHEQPPGLTRRRVVRTAGTAAWAAPVIVAATSAPAVAMSPAVSAAVLRAPNPSFSVLNNSISIRSTYTNFGTGPATSMLVRVTITPTAGNLTDADPVMENADFAFVERMGDDTGPQVLTFMKVDPQIPVDGSGRLGFVIQHEPLTTSPVDPLVAPTFTRTASVALAPEVPPPSTATSTAGSYTSREAP